MHVAPPNIAHLRHHSRRRHVLLAAATLGFLAAAAQLVLTREIIAVFRGDELTVGIALSCWLTLTGIGTWLGARLGHVTRPVRQLGWGLLLVGGFAVLEILALRAGRVLFFARGADIDPISVLVTCLIVLAPFCLGSGALLTLGCHTLLREDDAAAVGRVYCADACGSIIGAVLFTFFFAQRLDHVATLCWLAAIVSAIAAGIGWHRHASSLLVVGLAAAAVAALVAWRGDLDQRSTQWQYERPVVFRASSPYGRLVITQQGDELTFFENGLPAYYAANAAQREEIAHFALAQRPNAKSVLLIGGSVGGTAIEILRHPSVERVTAVELDPKIIAAGRRFLPENLADPRIHVVLADARQYVRQTTERFDAILIHLPDPTTYQLNRFFTIEFMRSAQRVLNADGVVAFGCGHYENYASPELRQLLGAARATLAAAFKHVVVLPAARVFFIGSNGPLRRDIAAALAEQHVEATLVNAHYLTATLAEDRLAEIDRATAGPGPINHDLRPILSLLKFRHWLNQFAFPSRGLGVALGFLLIAGLVRFRAVPRLIFTAGFTGAALELVLLVALQTYYGVLYQQVGGIVATFMLGLALGAAAGNVAERFASPRRAIQLATGLMAIAAGLALTLPRLDIVPIWAGQTLIFGATFGLAALVGAQFSIASVGNATSSRRFVPRLFSADLFGAALGGIATAVFLLPTLGIAAVCVCTVGLNGLAILLCWPARGAT